jgi:hypothetical protein
MKSILILLSFFHSYMGYAQAQELQQLAYDIEKLAQLKSMYKSMVSGYNTLSKGYGEVINVSKGNFDLHKNYLDGLLLVNAPVKKYSKIRSIADNQALIVKEYNDAYRKYYASGLFLNTELLEMKANGKRIIDESSKALDELLLVVTPGSLRMNDEERIAAIDRIDVQVNNYLKAMRVMNAENQQLLLLRKQKQSDVKGMKALNGLK